MSRGGGGGGEAILTFLTLQMSCGAFRQRERGRRYKRLMALKGLSRSANPQPLPKIYDIFTVAQEGLDDDNGSFQPSILILTLDRIK